MQDQPVRRQIEQSTATNRNMAASEIFAAVMTGLIIRHQVGTIDAQILVKDAIALTKTAIRELMLEKML